MIWKGVIGLMEGALGLLEAERIEASYKINEQEAAMRERRRLSEGRICEGAVLARVEKVNGKLGVVNNTYFIPKEMIRELVYLELVDPLPEGTEIWRDGINLMNRETMRPVMTKDNIFRVQVPVTFKGLTYEEKKQYQNYLERQGIEGLPVSKAEMVLIQSIDIGEPEYFKDDVMDQAKGRAYQRFGRLRNGQLLSVKRGRFFGVDSKGMISWVPQGLEI